MYCLSVLFDEIVDDIVTLVQGFLVPVVDGEGDLIFSSEREQFVVSLLVPYFATVETRVVNDVRETEFGHSLSDLLRVPTSFGLGSSGIVRGPSIMSIPQDLIRILLCVLSSKTDIYHPDIPFVPPDMIRPRRPRQGSDSPLQSRLRKRDTQTCSTISSYNGQTE